MPEFLTQTRFDQFDLPEPILAGLRDAGFTHCTPIQAQSIPVTLAGKDVAGQAQTGTGKTAAFLVTLLANLLKLEELPADRPSALIVAPTRELALQIYADAKVIGGHCGFRLAQVVGGIDYRKQADVLREGADIVICTPGRVIDYIKQGILKTDAIHTLVIDEADRLFDLGFTRDMRYILKRLPHYDHRQSMLFSATLSHRVLELTYEYMNLPEVVTVEQNEPTVEGVEQTLFHVGRKEKLSLLLGLLEREDWTRMLIFANTKSGVDWLAKKLIGNGYPAEGISGDLHQRKRLKLMEGFKDGSLKILVATDVASRGIHVEDISHVVNYDLPQDPENYVHRIGRTARAGKKGRALTFACEDYVLHLEPMEKFLGQKIPVEWPGDELFLEDKAGPVKTIQRMARAERSGSGGPDRRDRSGSRSRKSRPPRRDETPEPEPRDQDPPQPESEPAQAEPVDKEGPNSTRPAKRRRSGSRGRKDRSPEGAEETPAEAREEGEARPESEPDAPPAQTADKEGPDSTRPAKRRRSGSRGRKSRSPKGAEEAPAEAREEGEARPESEPDAPPAQTGAEAERPAPVSRMGGIFGLGKGVLTLDQARSVAQGEKKGEGDPEPKSRSSRRRRRRKKKTE